MRYALAAVLVVSCGGGVVATSSSPDASTEPDASVLPEEDPSTVADAGTPSVDSAMVVVDAGIDVAVDGFVDSGGDAQAGVDAGDDAAADADAEPPPETVISVVTSMDRTCFLMSTARLFCAGRGLTSTPTLVPGVTDAVEVAVGGDGVHTAHTCVRRVGGTVDCWGNNAYGQLGDGTNTSRSTPTPVVGLADVVQIAASDNDSFTCARKSDGTVSCWGVNSYGNLGVGMYGGRHTTPAPVVGLTDAVDISIGAGGGCAIRNGGQVVCWGLAVAGVLGDGLSHEQCVYASLPGPCSTVPVPANVSDAVAIARGGSNVHVIRADGSVWSWGIAGSLGNGTPMFSALPVATLGPVIATKISAGRMGACAVLATGAVTCWGRDRSGQLGDGLPATDSTVPVGVLGIADATNVSHHFESVCALRPGGKVSCWGRNEFGNLANGTTKTITASPVDVVW